jgi:hypothetical protein
MPEDPEMFYDPTIVGSWSALAGRLDDSAVLARWAEAEPDLAGLNTVADLLAVWAEDGRDDRTNVVLAALVRLAAADGGRDDDVLLLTLHLFSGLCGERLGSWKISAPTSSPWWSASSPVRFGVTPGGGAPAQSPRTWEPTCGGRCSPSYDREADAIPIEVSSSRPMATSLGWCKPRSPSRGGPRRR